jgi:hypothetical protein
MTRGLATRTSGLGERQLRRANGCGDDALPGDDRLYRDTYFGNPARSVWSLTGFALCDCDRLARCGCPCSTHRSSVAGRAAAAPLLAGKAIEQPLMNAAHLIGEQREVGLVCKQP